MVKSTTIDSFFKTKNVETSQTHSVPQSVDQGSNVPDNSYNLNSQSQPRKSPRIDKNENDINSIERDPGLRRQIWDYPIEKRDEIRRAYIKSGPYQIVLSKYPRSKEKHPRSFQPSWFKLFPFWLEYSPTKDAAFCLPCYLFRPQYGHSAIDAFTVNGFQSWKKVRDGKNCALLAHIGKDASSFHRNAERACDDLMNQSEHIVQRFERHTAEQIIQNRLRLEVSVKVATWLAFQGCAFRGHDETKDSLNSGNFNELLKFIGSYNDKVANVLANAPKNATYTSPRVQKEILHVFSTKVMKVIRDEIGDAKFCLLIDEARDESKSEQMSIVLRFVDKDGYVGERFFGLVHVRDTATITLKEAIYNVLSSHNLDVQNIRGQGYDGAIATSREVIPVHHFFKKLNIIINIVGASCKRNDQLKAAHASNIAYFFQNDEIQSGKGKNQIGTLQRAGDTRWSSYLKSVSSLLKMYSATCEVLLNIIDDGVTPTQRGDADATYEALTSFKFVLILHIMRNILDITDFLCQALLNKAQDILNVMQLVSSTKLLIQKLRDEGWDKLLSDVKTFCESVNIPIPDLSVQYVARKGRARQQQDRFTIEHHYKVDIFLAVLDSQLQELNIRFNEQTTELLILGTALDPKEMLISFRIDAIQKLVQKFYPQDFSEYEMAQLRMQLEHFDHERQHQTFGTLSTISDLSQWLKKTKKAHVYPLVYRVVALILTLPVSTATTERSFSAMSFVKNKLQNKMHDEYLTDCPILFIEKEIARTINVDSIIYDFRDLKERRSLF
ncbi:uncharacterized protein LOC141677662 [Apium graveolens]|uniref:uncharacterized protein LOC141677662 n=1 Tax=Apium graveolens TaxID=4045 RepID=UPI003D7AD227